MGNIEFNNDALTLLILDCLEELAIYIGLAREYRTLLE